MSKVAIRRLDSITANDTTATLLVNENFEAIQEAIENTLSRDGTTPNFMDADLDMNSYRIINGGDAVEDSDYITLRQFKDKVSDAEQYAEAAEASAKQAEIHSQNAALSSASALSYADTALSAADTAVDAKDTAVSAADIAIDAKDIAVASAESASESAQIAEDLVNFGMIRAFFTADEWTLISGKYALQFPYTVVNGVYKSVDDVYTLATNIDIVSKTNSTTIQAQEPFDGYALLVDQMSEAISTFVYEQAVSSDTWTINHYLNKFPSVTIVDSAGTSFNAKVEYIDKDTCIVYMNGATTGKAYLN